MRSQYLYLCLLSLSLLSLVSSSVQSDDLLTLDNGTVKVGIDREKGAAITWLSWQTYPKNVVNVTDPGRLIQQSYYAGKSLNRQTNAALRRTRLISILENRGERPPVSLN